MFRHKKGVHYRRERPTVHTVSQHSLEQGDDGSTIIILIESLRVTNGANTFIKIRILSNVTFLGENNPHIIEGSSSWQISKTNGARQVESTK